LAGVLLLLACDFSAAAAESDPESLRVRFVGIDGATWRIIAPMMERGELPAFQRLTEEGAYMERFETMETTSSPVVWTTMATGVSPDQHGVADFVDRLPSGETIPVTSNSRRAEALWNVAGRYGRSVGVIGWWASWPAEAVNGYVVSDHANPATAEWMAQGNYYWTADPDSLRELDADIHPPALAELAERHWLTKDGFPFDELQRRGGLTDEQMEVLIAAPWNLRTPYSWWKTFYAVDRPHFTLAQQLDREWPTDLQMLYLRGPDPVQHYAWNLVEPWKFAFWKRAPHPERDRGLVEGIYRFLDTFLGEILDSLDSRTVLIVASDHGAEATRTGWIPFVNRRPGDHTTDAKGVLFVCGPRVRAGHRIQDADPYDVAPTLAWLLGLPVADDLPGEILFEAFEDDFVRRRPIATVASWGRRETTLGTRSKNDAALLEQLKSLGYIR